MSACISLMVPSKLNSKKYNFPPCQTREELLGFQGKYRKGQYAEAYYTDLKKRWGEFVFLVVPEGAGTRVELETDWERELYGCKYMPIFPEYHISMDEIGYRQGWFFSRKFFKGQKKHGWKVWSCEKEKAIRLLKNHLDFNKDGALEAFDYFSGWLSFLDDGDFVLTISW